MTKEKNIKKENKVKKSTKEVTEKKGFGTNIKIFLSGVKSEFKKVHWPTRMDMIKYSIATIVFVVFCSLFFYAIEIVFALIQTLIK